MVQITSFNTVDRAVIAKGMLESNGIVAEIGTDNSISTLFPPGMGNVGVPLYVPEKDAEEALKLLREHSDI